MKKIIPYIILAFISIIIGTFLGKFLYQHEVTSTMSQQEESESKTLEEYTCSMHPQIRQNEPGICPICEMDLIPLGSTDDNNDPTILQMTAESAKLAQVATTTVGRSPGSMETSSIQVEGTVALDESLTNVQSAHIGGRIDQMYVSFEGEYVKKGQLIATLYAAELLTATKELLTAVKNENKFPGLKDAAIQKVKNWKISDEQIQRVIESGQPIQDVNIYADYGGYITQRLVSEGDHVMEGELLYRLANTNRLWIEFNVFESDIPAVEVGQQVSFTGPALGDKSLKATISYIDPLMDPNSRSVIVRAKVTNRNNILKPGMLVKGTIQKPSSSSGQLLVPKTAVLWTGQRSVVYVAKTNDNDIPEYQYREVLLGDHIGTYYQVLSGIEEGEEVVSKGAFAIDAAAQLSNKSSMMNHDVSIKKDNTGNRNPNFSEVVSDGFKSQLEAFVNVYLQMKDALVETNALATGQSASEVMKQLELVNHVSLQSDPHDFWLEKVNALKSHLQKIFETGEVSEQRKQFEFVSELTIDLIEAFGMKDNQYYIQYCPMAFNNKGAEWISNETGIRNPYFGDKMLKCGQVLDTIGLIN